MESTMEIDDSLYSRQRYMLGDQAMKMMAASSVLLIGCDPLGVEVAKNLVLTGVKALYIADSKAVSEDDVKKNFYITTEDFKAQKTRSEACISRLMELNPYVTVAASDIDTQLNSAAGGNDGSYLQLLEAVKNVECIIATQCNLASQNIIDKICRESEKPKKFVSCNVFGLFSSVFCDFGNKFQVFDPKGEELKEVFIASITSENPGVVTCLENQMHGLESGDHVSFREIVGMTELNGQVREVMVKSPYAFSIGDTSNLSAYVTGGLAKQVQMPHIISHQPLETQLSKPELLVPDFGKMLNPAISHLGFMALHHFHEAEKCLPHLWDMSDADRLWSIALGLMEECKLDIPVDAATKRLISLLSCTCRSVLPPLAAVVGGVAAQEVLKSITGKYLPLKQWLYLDASELVDEFPPPELLRNISGLNECLGYEVVSHLSKLKVFMVGCGAIGCEMLKNLALLGVSTDPKEGEFVMTDNDVIEKSNLNRQFLFRSHHIRQHKSIVAALATKEINPEMNVKPLQYKVGPDTEQSVFTDAFFEEQDIVINALDNVEARRFIDSRCVTNQLPLVESGTMGPKGHIQVVVPFISESYSSQHDPVDAQVPYCTLKSFPSQIEHTIQWARDKFESLFNKKPTAFNKFWEDRDSGNGDGKIQSVARRLESGENIKEASLAVSLLTRKLASWQDCVSNARCKFEKYFNHKAKHLLHVFPLDTKLQDNSLFWSSPKRPPHPVEFDPRDPMHLQFIESYAALLASVHRIDPPKNREELSRCLERGLQTAQVPPFVPSRKEVITDENVTKPNEQSNLYEQDPEKLSKTLKEFLATSGKEHTLNLMIENFEKDDDSNHHIDFITSASNLRATMYGIEIADRLKTKRIAGRIIPAISTTTAAVAGLATIQFLQLGIQIMKNELATNLDQSSVELNDDGSEISKYRNCFLNLALPLVVFSEPAAAQRVLITDSLSFTLWDRWDVCGSKDFKLKDFIQHFKNKYDLNVSMVVQGVKMVYVPVMPGHSKRLDHAMNKLIKITGVDQQYVDLTIGFENDSMTDDDEDLPCPPVRYFFGL